MKRILTLLFVITSIAAHGQALSITARLNANIARLVGLRISNSNSITVKTGPGTITPSNVGGNIDSVIRYTDSCLALMSQLYDSTVAAGQNLQTVTNSGNTTTNDMQVGTTIHSIMDSLGFVIKNGTNTICKIYSITGVEGNIQLQGTTPGQVATISPDYITGSRNYELPDEPLSIGPGSAFVLHKTATGIVVGDSTTINYSQLQPGLIEIGFKNSATQHALLAANSLSFTNTSGASALTMGNDGGGNGIIQFNENATSFYAYLKAIGLTGNIGDTIGSKAGILLTEGWVVPGSYGSNLATKIQIDSIASSQLDSGIVYRDSINAHSTRLAAVVKYTDTSAMLSAYIRWLTFLDSTTTIQARIGAKVNYTDTAAMLAGYARFLALFDTASSIRATIPTGSTYVKYTDTASMLSAYVRWLSFFDTASAHMTLIQARVKYTDTGAMLAGYARVLALFDTASSIRASFPSSSVIASAPLAGNGTALSPVSVNPICAGCVVGNTGTVTATPSTVYSVTTTGAANNLVETNSSANIIANNFLSGFTISSAISVTLNATSAQIQVSSNSNPTYTLPTSMPNGTSYTFLTEGGQLTVKGSDGQIVGLIPANVSSTIFGGTFYQYTTPSSAGSSWFYVPLLLGIDNGAFNWPVQYGGTGLSSITSHGVMYGNGTNNTGVTAAGTTGQIFTSVTSGAPVWTTPSTPTAIVASVPVATDANQNVAVNNLWGQMASTVTSTVNVTLTVSSKKGQQFTGSTSGEVVILPVAATMAQYQDFQILNGASVPIVIQTSGLISLTTVNALSACNIVCVNTAGGTGTAPWYVINQGILNSTINSSSGSILSIQTFTSGTTLTVPAGANAMIVEQWGGGGGGGYAIGSATTIGCGGGGSAGAHTKSYFSGISGTYTYAIGAAGAGGIASTATAALAGGNTTITVGGTTVTAGGGNPGTSDPGSVTVGHTTGFGNPSTATNGNIENAPGQTGDLGVSNTILLGYGGAGGSTSQGSGGGSINTSGVGLAGNGYGTGSGGAFASGSTLLENGGTSNVGGYMIVTWLR